MKSNHSEALNRRPTPASGLCSEGLKRRGIVLYTIEAGGVSITCHACGFTSHDPEHVRQKYCPSCRVFHEDRILMLRLAEGYEAEFHPLSGVEPSFKAAA